MTETLVRGGTVVTAEGRRRADVRCRDGRIAEVGEGLAPGPGAAVIDAGGCYVMPGGVDPHTHLQLPMMGTVVADDFLSGTAAAAAGGTTTLLDFVGPERGQSPLEALATWQGLYDRSYRGDRSPVIIGNHFETWNGGAYTDSLTDFLEANCRKPDTYCVSNEELLHWLQAEPPATLAALSKPRS